MKDFKYLLYVASEHTTTTIVFETLLTCSIKAIEYISKLDIYNIEIEKYYITQDLKSESLIKINRYYATNFDKYIDIKKLIAFNN